MDMLRLLIARLFGLALVPVERHQASRPAGYNPGDDGAWVMTDNGPMPFNDPTGDRGK